MRSAAFFLLLPVALSAGAAAGPLPIKLVQDLPLPGGPTRFDYQWVDSANGRLYIAHLGAASIDVFDLRAGKVVGVVEGLPSVHGVVAVPERHLVFATVTGRQQLAIIDDRTLTVTARVPAGEYPNGLAYDPRTKRVLISNNTGLGIAVVDTTRNEALPGIDIGGGAGNSQYDAASGHVFVTVHRLAVLVEIDPVALKIIARHPLKGVRSCHGLLVAADLHLAFAACGGENGPKLLTFDLEAGRQSSLETIPPQADVLAFDPGRRRVYVSSSTGRIAMFDVTADRLLTNAGEGFVGPNAHTVSVDPQTHNVYFPLENLRGRAVLRVMAPR
ncbi:MAG TPA: YncE family protein [Polyangia bacterium]|nr:YncE family protein [Polyangia bacterium]